MREVTRREVWVTVFTCQCGRQVEMWHHGEKGRPTETNYPSSGKWDGWDLRNERCPSCVSGRDEGGRVRLETTDQRARRLSDEADDRAVGGE